MNRITQIIFLFVITYHCSLLYAAIPDEERQALIDFYYSTGGNNWANNDGWLGEAGSECNWFGIVCDGGKSHIYEIKLDNNNLIGEINKSISKLTNLTIIDFSWNKIDTIPPEIGNLFRLDSLCLKGNKLITVPPEIGNLCSLAFLDLSYNDLNTVLPEIGKLSNLIHLDLRWNNLSKVYPEIGDLNSLSYLDLSTNNLHDVPAEIGKLSNLTKLFLSSNYLSKLPAEIGKLSNLKHLYLSYNSLMTLPTEIKNLRNLSFLDLGYNDLKSVPSAIFNISSLTSLDLEDNKLKTIPSQIDDLKNLNLLDLSDNNLTAIQPEILNIKNLTILSLSSNSLSIIPPEIENITKLTHLHLFGNKIKMIPLEISNLKNSLEITIHCNAIETFDPNLIKFLDSKQINSKKKYWKKTQTISPKQLTIKNTTSCSVLLAWSAIYYTENKGAYEVNYRKSNNALYNIYDITENKTVEQMHITGLSHNTTYYFKVRSITYPHTNNSQSYLNNNNTVYSRFSNEITATTLSIPSPNVKLFSLYDLGISNNDQITKKKDLILIGTCQNESKINFFVGNLPMHIQDISCDINNQFSANLLLPEGINIITATQTDKEGNVSKPSIPLTITVDTQVDNFDIEQTDLINENSCSWALDIENITLFGNRELNSTISVDCHYASQINIFYPDNTTWEAELTDMPTGQYTVVIYATDIAGNESSIEKTIYRLKPKEVIIESPNEMFADGISITPLSFSFYSEDHHELCVNKDVVVTSSTGNIMENTKYVDKHQLFCDYQAGLELGKTIISVYYQNKKLGSTTIDMIAGPINRMVLILDNTFQDIDMPGQFIKLQIQDGYGHPVPVKKDLNITLESTAKSKAEFSILQDYWNWQIGSATLILASGEKEIFFKYKSSIPGIFSIKASEYPDTGLYDAILNIQIIDQPIATLQNPPSTITSTTDFQFYVQGDYVSAYQYKIDQHQWSLEKSISEPIILTGLYDGIHTLSIIGKNELETWQDKSSATVFSWAVKTQVKPPNNLFLPSEYDTGILSNDLITKESNLIIKGSCEPNASIQIYDNHQRIDTPEIKFQDSEFTASIILSEGTHRISAIQIDSASNQSGPSEGLTITVDQTPPDIYVYPEGGSYQNAMSINLSSNDEAARLFYFFHGQTEKYRPFFSPIYIDSNAQLSFYAEDEAGNKSQTKTKTYSFTPEANHYDIKIIPETSARQIVNVGGSIKYQIEIIPKENFKGEMDVRCNGISEGFSYYFYQNNEKTGSDVSDIQTIPCHLTLELNAMYPDIGTYQFNLVTFNSWDGGSAPMKNFPLSLKVIHRNQSGIHLEIEDTHMNKGSSVLLYGAILPPLDKQKIRLNIDHTINSLQTVSLETTTGGQFQDDQLLSSLQMGAYTLTASWIDNNSNLCQSKNKYLYVNREKSYINCFREGTGLPEVNENITISGQLIPEQAFEAIKLKMISPEGNTYSKTVFTDESGFFQITDKFCHIKGTWRFKASWKGNDQTMHCESNVLPVLVGAPGKVIIIGGGGKDLTPYWESTKLFVREVYENFKQSGFTDDLIYLMINLQTIDINQDDIIDPIIDDHKPTKQDVIDIINSDFTTDLDSETPLFIYIQGHGTDDARIQVLDSSNFISAKEISNALDQLQETTHCPVIVIIESCYSGNFIPELSNNKHGKRLILTSAGNEKYVTDRKHQLPFSTHLFYSLKDRGNHFYKAYKESLEKMNQYENYCTPLFDDNGDGKHDENDGILASNLYLPAIQIWGLPPYIDNITVDHIIQNKTSTPIFVDVIKGDRPIQKVWTQIIHPQMQLTGIEGIINPKNIELTYNADQHLYVGNVDHLYQNGVFTLSTYAMDLENKVSETHVTYIKVTNTIQTDLSGDNIINLKDVIIGLQLLCQIPVNAQNKLADIQIGLRNILWAMETIGE